MSATNNVRSQKLPTQAPRKRVSDVRFALSLCSLAAGLLAVGCVTGPSQSGDGAEPVHPATASPAKLRSQPHAATPGGVDEVVIDERLIKQVQADGEADFFVVMAEQADLSLAPQIQNWVDRGSFVVDRLREVARTSQGEVLALVRQTHGLAAESFWIANAVLVRGGNFKAMQELAQTPGVSQLLLDSQVEFPQPVVGVEEATIGTVEWGVDRVRAPEAWSTFGVRGEGIIIANIDTGVDYQHPALVTRYRGHTDGSFDHNHNWFDPTGVCSGTAPCDNNAHGTHTMGTMVGGVTNRQIGVAPAAKWIAAKGCAGRGCSTSHLLASGQWMLAPTDSNGDNPRTDLRPHIVNNSWGGPGGSTMYQAIVTSWVASGIFPAFSNGNSGSSCGTSGSPGDFVNSYSAGAFDSGDRIASFSSRGPSAFSGEIKPNLSAPGVNVTSSTPGGSYRAFSGTSMASPHLAGAVALMWSAAPSLVGDISATRDLLDRTSIDVNDTRCGGTADDNNTWGEGKLDAYAAVDASPRGPSGRLVGTVTAAGNGAAVANAVVSVTGASTRQTRTNAMGQYAVRLSVGDYTVSTRAFGYLAGSHTATITQDTDTTLNIALELAPTHTLSGTVTDTEGNPVGGARLRLVGTPLSVVTNAQGAYSFDAVPEGTYELEVIGGGRCFDAYSQTVSVLANLQWNVEIAQREDGFGYTCRPVASDYIEARHDTRLRGDDSYTRVRLPFAFRHYGLSYTRAYVGTNGLVSFSSFGARSYYNQPIPSFWYPNDALYPFWDDLYVDYESSVRTETVGTAPDRKFVIEWRNVRFYADSSRRVDFEVVLMERGSRAVFQYRGLDGGREAGNSASIGLEDRYGQQGFEYSYNQESLDTPTFAIMFTPPPTAIVRGTVSDRNDGLPVRWATIVVRDAQGREVRRINTDYSGQYEMALRLGTYTVEAAATHYVPESQSVLLDVADVTHTLDYSLRTARAELDTTQVEAIMLEGEGRTRTLVLSNTGSADMTWSIRSYYSPAWVSFSPMQGSLAVGESQAIQVTFDTASLGVGWYRAYMTLASNSGRRPRIGFRVKAVVTDYRVGTNAGCDTMDCPQYPAYLDGLGDTWVADQRWTDGGWGYLHGGQCWSTRRNIDNTADPALYQVQREEPYGYRFDGLPPGVYQIEVRLAELEPDRAVGDRFFDVVIDDRLVLPAWDTVLEVGPRTANDHGFFHKVTDGRLDVRFVRRSDFEEPSVGALRVTRRPDYRYVPRTDEFIQQSSVSPVGWTAAESR